MKLGDRMKIGLFLVPFLWCMLSAGVANAELEMSVDAQIFDDKQSERIILVTYSDKHINRVPIGTSSHAYRRSGDYSSSSWSKRIAASLESDYKLKLLSQWPIKEIGEHCVVYLVGENHSIDDVINALSKDERVENVQLMNTFHVLSASRYSDPYYRLQSNIQSINLAEIHSQATGKNVTIAIVDTGVDAKHPDLDGQIQSSKDFVAQKSLVALGDNHGTAIAGVIAAKPNNGQGIVGIAPDSNVVSLKACWGTKEGALEAVCNSFTLALAINTAIEMKVDVLNLSLTGPHDPLLAKLIDKAVKQGIIVVASQADKVDGKSGFPSQQPGVIGVRSTHSQDLLPTKSEHVLAVTAPGQDILTTLPNGAYDFVSGNSLATAHISGLAALLLQSKRNVNSYELMKLLATANEPTFYKVFRKGRLDSSVSMTTDNNLIQTGS